MGKPTLPEEPITAAEACTQIEAWLARQRRRTQRDHTALLAEIRRRLAQICAFDLVQDDSEAQAVLLDMTRERGMAALEANVDRLCSRVQELLARRDNVASRGIDPAPQSSLRSPLSRSSRRFDDDALDVSSRTLLRL